MSKVAKAGARTAATRAKRPKPLIYVVDDEPMLLQLACLILMPLGFQVRTFRDPEEALKCFASATIKPKLVITDYAMHKVNGMELVLRCKRLNPTQKVMLVSGTVGPEVFADSPVKPDCFLPKPYEADQLRQAVIGLLGRKQA